MDSSMLTILPPKVQIPSTPSMLLSFRIKFVLCLSCEKNENKQNVAGLGPFFLKKTGELLMGSGCGSAGSVVASESGDLQFKSSHRQILFNISCIKKDKNEVKRCPKMDNCLILSTHVASDTTSL